jgi:hypothetical protein
LVERRLQTLEKIGEQKRLIRLSKPGSRKAPKKNGFRLGWSRVLVVLLSTPLALGSYLW